MVASNLHLLHAKEAPENAWRAAWHFMVDDGTAAQVFADGTVTTEEEFTREMRSTHVHPHLVYCDGQVAAIVWLTNLEGRSARGHFVVFGAHMKKARHLGRFALQQLLSYTYDNGEHCFDVITGMVPRRNMIAVNTCLRAGFKKVGIIPNGAWIASEGRSEDMVLLAATREDIE